MDADSDADSVLKKNVAQGVNPPPCTSAMIFQCPVWFCPLLFPGLCEENWTQGQGLGRRRNVGCVFCYLLILISQNSKSLSNREEAEKQSIVFILQGSSSNCSGKCCNSPFSCY